MELRPYCDRDASATRRVFEQAVRTTASGDYTSRQIEAWAPAISGASEAEAWAAARAAAVTIVAVGRHQVVGFSDLVHGSLLDMLYVDPEAGRRGVGSALVTRIVALAQERGAASLETYASLTARRLFERFGFVAVERRAPVVRGVQLTNFRMCLGLGAIDQEATRSGEAST